MSSPTLQDAPFPVRVFGGPTALFEYGGLRFLTDPSFAAAGLADRVGFGLRG